MCTVAVPNLQALAFLELRGHQVGGGCLARVEGEHVKAPRHERSKQKAQGQNSREKSLQNLTRTFQNPSSHSSAKKGVVGEREHKRTKETTSAKPEPFRTYVVARVPSLYQGH